MVESYATRGRDAAFVAHFLGAFGVRLRVLQICVLFTLPSGSVFMDWSEACARAAESLVLATPCAYTASVLARLARCPIECISLAAFPPVHAPHAPGARVFLVADAADWDGSM